MLRDDTELLTVFDEADPLKNKNNLTYGAFSDLNSPRKVVLTGFPVQNSLTEFFNLVRVVDPTAMVLKNETKAKQFADKDAHGSKYDELVLAVHKGSDEVMHRKGEAIMRAELTNIARTSFNSYIVMNPDRESITGMNSLLSNTNATQGKLYDALLDMYKTRSKGIKGKKAYAYNTCLQISTEWVFL